MKHKEGRLLMKSVMSTVMCQKTEEANELSMTILEQGDEKVEEKTLECALLQEFN